LFLSSLQFVLKQLMR